MDSAAWPYFVEEFGMPPDNGGCDGISSLDVGLGGSDSSEEDDIGEDGSLAWGDHSDNVAIGGVLVTLDADGDVVMAVRPPLVHNHDVEVEGECDHKPGDVGEKKLSGDKVDCGKVSVGIASGDDHRDEIDKRQPRRFESEKDSGPYDVEK